MKSRAKLVEQFRGEAKRCPKTKEARIALLRKWAEVKAAPAGALDTYESRRAKHHKGRRRPASAAGQCWACVGWADLVDHHVIQIQHGGHNWHLNIVRICGECHADIHPWLTKPIEKTQHAPEKEPAPF